MTLKPQQTKAEKENCGELATSIMSGEGTLLLNCETTAGIPQKWNKSAINRSAYINKYEKGRLLLDLCSVAMVMQGQKAPDKTCCRPEVDTRWLRWAPGLTEHSPPPLNGIPREYWCVGEWQEKGNHSPVRRSKVPSISSLPNKNYERTTNSYYITKMSFETRFMIKPKADIMSVWPPLYFYWRVIIIWYFGFWW